MDSYQQDEEHARILREDNVVSSSRGILDGTQDRSPNQRSRRNILLASSLILLGYLLVAFSSSSSGDENNAAFGGLAIPFLGHSKTSSDSDEKFCRDFADHVYSAKGISVSSTSGTFLVDNFTWVVKKTDDPALFEYHCSSLTARPETNDTIYLDYGVLKLVDPDSTYGHGQYCDFMAEYHVFDFSTGQWATRTANFLGISWDGNDWIITSSDADTHFSVVTTPVHKEKHCKHRVEQLIAAYENEDIEYSQDLLKICNH